MPIYGCSLSKLNTIQEFFDRFYERRCVTESVNINAMLERQDKPRKTNKRQTKKDKTNRKTNKQNKKKPKQDKQKRKTNKERQDKPLKLQKAKESLI